MIGLSGKSLIISIALLGAVLVGCGDGKSEGTDQVGSKLLRDLAILNNCSNDGGDCGDEYGELIGTCFGVDLRRVELASTTVTEAHWDKLEEFCDEIYVIGETPRFMVGVSIEELRNSIRREIR